MRGREDALFQRYEQEGVQRTHAATAKASITSLMAVLPVQGTSHQNHAWEAGGLPVTACCTNGQELQRRARKASTADVLTSFDRSGLTPVQAVQTAVRQEHPQHRKYGNGGSNQSGRSSARRIVPLSSVRKYFNCRSS